MRTMYVIGETLWGLMFEKVFDQSLALQRKIVLQLDGAPTRWKSSIQDKLGQALNTGGKESKPYSNPPPHQISTCWMLAFSIFYE